MFLAGYSFADICSSTGRSRLDKFLDFILLRSLLWYCIDYLAVAMNQVGVNTGDGGIEQCQLKLPSNNAPPAIWSIKVPRLMFVT